MDLPHLKFGPFECRTLYGEDGAHRDPYMSQVILGSLRLHVFHRGDNDPDPHNHPWPFWTFPLVDYVEEVTTFHRWKRSGLTPVRKLNPVKRWRVHHRPATYTHRVLYRAKRVKTERGFHRFEQAEGPIVTLVWSGKTVNEWGFLKTRDGKWCWVAWKDYVFRGGKHGPCE